MNGIIDDIKEKVDLLDLVQEKVEMRRSGRNYVGRCPFHEDATPSLVVFPTSTWKCMAGSCNSKGGDVFDWVMQLNPGMEMKEAIRTLAGRAGISLKAPSAEEQKSLTILRDREAIFDMASLFFAAQMKEGTPGYQYVTGERGWEPEWLKDGRIGWFGKDWGALRDYLQKNQVDLEHPAAVALIGFKGDVKAWGEKWGVNVAQDEIEGGKIHAMPPNMVIYAHVWRGRAVYLSGRRLDEAGKPMTPKSWNLPEYLCGPKAPYFNHVWLQERTKNAEGQVFVIQEGQGDALTMAGWVIPTVSLVGLKDRKMLEDVNSDLLSELKRTAQAGGRILIGLDSDKAGQSRVGDVAAALKTIGLSAVQFGRVSYVVVDGVRQTWPAKDVNDWLTGKDLVKGAEVGTAERAKKLLDNSPSWLECLIAEAAPKAKGEKADEDGVRAVFDALAKLDGYEVERWREAVADVLDIRRRMFDGLLRAARREQGQTDDGQPRYFVEAGRTFARNYDSMGNEIVDPLCNFTALIKRDVLKDNGQDILREFWISGKVGKRHLATAKVKAGEFSDMVWVLKEWGSQAIIEAGGRKKDALRAAIQYLSREVKHETIYSHTGWREIEVEGQTKRVFLSTLGAVGTEGINVDLGDKEHMLYEIPLQPVAQEKAMRHSLSFLELAPRHVTMPLWAAIWLAPLCELVNVAFTMWIYGRSGAMKSTLAAVALNHYGPLFNDKRLPANFEDTANILEYKSFLAKDVLFLVDDFAPQNDARGASKYLAAAHRILRDAGNKSGRGRMGADSQAKATYWPRGLVMITGEDMPDTESLVARMFVIEMKKGEINLQSLTAMQKQKEQLSHAMAGYVLWLADNWQGLMASVPNRWAQLRQKAEVVGGHLRLPEAVAGLALGLEMGLRYELYLGVITNDQYGVLIEEGWNAIVLNANSMATRVTEEKPDSLFTRTLAELLAQGKVYLKYRNIATESVLGSSGERSEMIGWFDEDHLYLLPEASYNLVAKHFRERGQVFPLREQTLRKHLDEAGILIAVDEDGQRRRTQSLSMQGKSQRVMVLLRSKIDGAGGSTDKVD